MSEFVEPVRKASQAAAPSRSSESSEIVLTTFGEWPVDVYGTPLPHAEAIAMAHAARQQAPGPTAADGFRCGTCGDAGLDGIA